jgi:hypothetical protein
MRARRQRARVASPRSLLRVDVEALERVSLVVASGTLDSSTYRELRNMIVKAALDEPDAVIVDVSQLEVPSPSALAVFTSARWHVTTWPDVPILLACSRDDLRSAIRTRGITRYVPAYSTVNAALESVSQIRTTIRRRARVELPAVDSSAAMARTLVSEWLTKWDHPALIPTASTVATIFIENVLAHTDSAPALIIEHKGDTLTVAVEDNSQRLANRHEDPQRGSDVVSGLAIVAALSRVWGSTPTATGKTVWAVVGPENAL